MRGAFVMVLLLAGMQVVLSSKYIGGVSGAAAYPGQLAAQWMSPAVPLIRDRSRGAAPASTSPAAGQVVAGAAGAAASTGQSLAQQLIGLLVP